MLPRWYITVLLVLFIVIVGVGGWLVYNKPQALEGMSLPRLPGTAPVAIKPQTENIDRILTAVGWDSASELRLPDGTITQRGDISKVELVYSDQVQPYFTQESGPGEPPFAAMNVAKNGSTLKITAFLDSEALKKLESDAERNNLVSAMLIQAMTSVTHPEMTPDEVARNTVQTLSQFKDTPAYTIKVR